MTYGEIDPLESVKKIGRRRFGFTLLSPNKLIGNKVDNALGEPLGDIRDIVLDTENGCIAYAVVAKESVVLTSEKLFAVPWTLLKLDVANHRFILNVDKNQFDNALGFDSKHWPDSVDQAQILGVRGAG